MQLILIYTIVNNRRGEEEVDTTAANCYLGGPVTHSERGTNNSSFRPSIIFCASIHAENTPWTIDLRLFWAEIFGAECYSLGSSLFKQCPAATSPNGSAPNRRRDGECGLWRW